MFKNHLYFSLCRVMPTRYTFRFVYFILFSTFRNLILLHNCIKYIWFQIKSIKQDIFKDVSFLPLSPIPHSFFRYETCFFNLMVNPSIVSFFSHKLCIVLIVILTIILIYNLYIQNLISFF